jgi:hypothetical protein
MSSYYRESIYFDLKNKDLVLEAFSLIQEEICKKHHGSKWDVTECEGKVKISVDYDISWLNHEENYAIINLVAEVCEAFIQGYLIGKGIPKQEQ